MRLAHLAPYILLLLAGAAMAQSVYRCGNSYSTQPCAGAKVLEMRTPPVSPPAGESGKPALTEAQRLDALTEQGLRDSRRRELEQTRIPSANMAIAQLRQDCEDQQAALERRKYSYVQNLYGVTDRAAVANEQTNASIQCDSRIRELQERLSTLRAECAKLNCNAQ